MVNAGNSADSANADRVVDAERRSKPIDAERRSGPTGHIDLDELADAGEGLLSPERQGAVDAHLAGCEECRARFADLAGVTDQLAAAPAPSMPEAVFARLQHTLAGEQAQRETAAAERARGQTGADKAPGAPYADKPTGRGGQIDKPNLAEHYTDTMDKKRGLRAKFAGGAVAATLIASAVGFGGYLASASAGAAEPPQDQPIVVSANALQASAATAVAQDNLSSYPFTRAWFCVRKVTDGRITGIRATVLNGESGYLAFLQGQDGVRAVFVSGCDTGDPQAGPSVAVREK